MREILFRGKRKDNNNPWIYGYLHKMDGYGTGYTEYGIQVQDTSTSRPWSVLVIPETVGQYTGLTDKNGKKIFEGDIVKWDGDEISQIRFCDGVYRLCNAKGYYGVAIHNHYSYVEVIGNIHDNPELLKGE